MSHSGLRDQKKNCVALALEGLLLSVRGPDFSQCDRAPRLPRGLLNAILSSRRCRSAVDVAIDSGFFSATHV